MKFSFPVTCGCSETFPVHVTGAELPKSAECPKCKSTIWLVEPLGNVVGMAILGRAATELKNGDSTLAIVSAAMAVECELVYLFMKWNRIDLMLVRNPTDADDDGWEKQWRDDVRTVAARFDKVSGLLTGQSFDSFLPKHSELLKIMHAGYPASKGVASLKDFFVKEFFHKRNKIVHFGKIDFQQPDAEMCLTLATTLSQILTAMDAQRRRLGREVLDSNAGAFLRGAA
jgi:hypothetical protein